MVTRRAFIGGSAAVAAGAALGVQSDKVVRTKLGMYFFGPEPLMFDARLSTDPFTDLLSVEVLHEESRVLAQLPVAAVKRALAAPGAAASADVRIWRDGILGQRFDEDQIEVIVQKGLLSLRGRGEEAAPAWLPLEDVRRAL